MSIDIASYQDTYLGQDVIFHPGHTQKSLSSGSLSPKITGGVLVV